MPDGLFTESESPTHPGTRYECRSCELTTERFRAKDNAPEHAHLCRECARLLDPKFLEEHFVDLGPP